MAPTPLSPGQRQHLTTLAEIAVQKFTQTDWMVLGARTGGLDTIRNHHRLLRSLSFGDEDYEGHVYDVMFQLAEGDGNAYHTVTSFIEERHGDQGINISTTRSKSRKLVFSPSAFEVPEGDVEDDLVAVMMPFQPQFEPVFQAISEACRLSNFRCLRAKDIWNHQTIIQDIFDLIFRSQIVICDFTGKNPNVFYEAGIAHVLGKLVIPITQSAQDIPFDLQHHRYLQYLDNAEGRETLTKGLVDKLWNQALAQWEQLP